MAAAAAWIDEITLCRDPEILTVVQGRLRFTGTPKGKNWLWQDVMQTLTEVEPGRVWRSDRWGVFRFRRRGTLVLPIEVARILAVAKRDGAESRQPPTISSSADCAKTVSASRHGVPSGANASQR
jgi:hypothetical protein